MSKKILYILRKPPYHGALAQETLDIILTLAAFDQFVNLLFLDDAVFLLKKDQQPESAGLKNPAAIMQALPLYDIEKVYVESESLGENGLSPSDLSLAAIPVMRADVAHLCK